MIDGNNNKYVNNCTNILVIFFVCIIYLVIYLVSIYLV